MWNLFKVNTKYTDIALVSLQLTWIDFTHIFCSSQYWLWKVNAGLGVAIFMRYTPITSTRVNDFKNIFWEHDFTFISSSSHKAISKTELPFCSRNVSWEEIEKVILLAFITFKI